MKTINNMNTIKYRIRMMSTLLFAAIVVSTSSCSVVNPTDEPTSEQAEVVLNLKTPGAFSAPKTRSLDYSDENKINDIYVLVFDKSNKLVAIKQGTDIQSTPGSSNPSYSGTGSFSVTLAASKNQLDTYNLVVLANARTILNNTIGTGDSKVGTLYSDLMPQIWDAITGAMYTGAAGSGQTIPMWGESGQIVIEAGANNQNLQLTRAVSRIDVGVGAPSYNSTNHTYSWNGKDKNGNTIPFQLTNVYIIRPNNRYAVAPNPLIAAGNPTIPTGTTAFSVTDSESKFAFTTPAGCTTQSIYLPEADIIMGGAAKPGDTNHTNRMAVVVGGYYNGSGTKTFYRLDFAQNSKLINTLRNHLYQFNISSVSGAGYSDVATAYASLAMNMTVDIYDWDEANMGDIEFDGTYYFSITDRKIVFDPLGGQTTTVTIKTNVTDFKMYVDGGTSPVIAANGTLTYGPTAKGFKYTLAKGAADTYTLTIESTLPNVSNTDPSRTEPWSIVAKRMNVSFQVDQQWTRLYVSVSNGAVARLYPEGTTTGAVVPIDIISQSPVIVTCSDTWVGGYANITSPTNGLYKGHFDLTVPVYRLGTDGTTDRTATLTITPQGDTPITYLVTQEAPYIKVLPTYTFLYRPFLPQVFTVPVDVVTNVSSADLSLSRTGRGTGENLIQIGSGLKELNPMYSRYQRFTVVANMTGTLPGNGFDALFTVTPTAGKYGALSAASFDYRVTSEATVIDIRYLTLDAHYESRPLQFKSYAGYVRVQILNPDGTPAPQDSWLKFSKLETYPNNADIQRDPTNALILSEIIDLTESDPSVLKTYWRYLYADENISGSDRSLLLRVTSTAGNDITALDNPTLSVTTNNLITQKTIQLAGLFGGDYSLHTAGYPKQLGVEYYQEYTMLFKEETPSPVRTSLQWGFDGITTNVKDANYGLPGTKTLAALGKDDNGGLSGTYDPIYNTYAARYCFEKNRDTNGNGVLDDDEIKWYLPAQNQLMGVWDVYTAIKTTNPFNAVAHWSATEFATNSNRWYVHFNSGNPSDAPGANLYRVRCVRDL